MIDYSNLTDAQAKIADAFFRQGTSLENVPSDVLEKLAKSVRSGDGMREVKNYLSGNQGGMLSNIGQGVGNAVNSIKQGMANQGARNFADNIMRDGTAMPYSQVLGNARSGNPDELRQMAMNMPMAIPALGGALGTGALMAAGAGAGVGLLADYALLKYGSNLVYKQQADSAQQVARALEASQMNSSRDRNISDNGTNNKTQMNGFDNFVQNTFR
jgi:hypothetical protein